MVLKVVLALKHCPYSFLKQSYSLSTFLCPLSLFPLFATRITWCSVGHFPNISLLLSSLCKGKLLISRVGLKKLQSELFFSPKRTHSAAGKDCYQHKVSLNSYFHQVNVSSVTAFCGF